MDAAQECSRVFVVCGKAAEAEQLTQAFTPFGLISSVKLVRDKGVAYIKFDKASHAAKAIETMHEAVLNNGRGPLLKVFLAEAPGTRRGGQMRLDQELYSDPDNMPPRSRLFLVVPKTADAALIEAELARFSDLQYCKTDLIASKGVVFCKYTKSSAALTALEAVQETGMLAGYKVKCMLAEPKGKRMRTDSGWGDSTSPVHQLGPDYGQSRQMALQLLGTGPYRSASYSPTHSSHSTASLSSSLNDPRFNNGSIRQGLPGQAPTSGVGLAPHPEQPYDTMLNSLANLQALAAMQGAANLGTTGALGAGSGPVPPPTPMPTPVPQSPGPANGMVPSPDATVNSMVRPHARVGLARVPGFPPSAGPPLGMGELTGLPNGTPANSTSSSCSVAGKQRLFVVIHKGASEEHLHHIFRSFPGMEYCNLKRDRMTGASKGYAYVSYSTPEAAAAAVDQLHGLEFPQGSGQQLKVMFADPMTLKGMPKQLSPQASSRLPSTASADSEEVLQHTNGLPSPGLPGDDLTSRLPLRIPPPAVGSFDERLQHGVEVAAVQNSLAHMSMPASGQHALTGLRNESESPGSTASLEFQSPPTDERVVWTVLSRPLPEYAIHHTVQACGLVDLVRLQPDERVALVRFQTADAAARALEQLHGTEVCGLDLSITRTDPLQHINTTKRQRF